MSTCGARRQLGRPKPAPSRRAPCGRPAHSQAAITSSTVPAGVVARRLRHGLVHVRIERVAFGANALQTIDVQTRRSANAQSVRRQSADCGSLRRHHRAAQRRARAAACRRPAADPRRSDRWRRCAHLDHRALGAAACVLGFGQRAQHVVARLCEFGRLSAATSGRRLRASGSLGRWRCCRPSFPSSFLAASVEHPADNARCIVHHRDHPGVIQSGRADHAQGAYDSTFGVHIGRNDQTRPREGK